MDEHSLEPISFQDSVEDDPAIVHWSIFDTWLGIGLFVTFTFLALLAAAFIPLFKTTGVLFMVGFEFREYLKERTNEIDQVRRIFRESALRQLSMIVAIYKELNVLRQGLHSS